MNTSVCTVVEFNLTNHTFQKLTLDDLNLNLPEKNKIYWIHLALNQDETLDKIASVLQLPEDVLELCANDDPMPKLIDADENLTIQIQCIISDKQKEVDFGSLIIHLTNKFCFTASRTPLSTISEFEATYHKAVRYAKTPCFILFLFFDICVNEYAKVLFNFELIADDMDFEVRKTHHNIYHEVMDVKQQVMKIKRYIIAIREILMRISGRKISVISDQCRSSLYNLSHHNQMVVNEIDSIRDMLNSMLDQIDNVLMQKINETMRVLTTFAAIFLPLTLITGIYGMNFHWIPELTWKYGYFYSLGLILLCGLILFYAFKKMKWF